MSEQAPPIIEVFPDRVAQIRAAQDLYNSGDLSAAKKTIVDIKFELKEQNTELYANYCMVQGSILAETNRLAAAELVFNRAETIFLEIGNSHGAAFAVFNLGNVLKYGGADRLARDRYRKAAAHFAEAGDKVMQSSAMLSVANTCVRREELAELKQSLDEFTAISQGETLPPLTQWSFASALCKQAELTGDLDAVLAHAEEALSFARESGHPGYIGEALLLLGTVNVRRGETKAALPLVEEARDLLVRSGDQRAVDAEALLRRLIDTPASPPPSRPQRPMHDMAPAMVAQGLDHATVQSVLNDLQQASICIIYAGDAYIALAADDGGVHCFDAATIAPTTLVDAFTDRPSFKAALLGIASALSEAGVKARAEGRFREAADACGVCLQVALLHESVEGLTVSSHNMFVAERMLSAMGKGAPTTAPPLPSDFRETLDRIRSSAAAAATAMKPMLEALSIRGAEHDLLDALVAHHRLLLSAQPDTGLDQNLLPAWAGGGVLGDRPDDDVMARRARLAEMRQLAEHLGSISLIFEALYAELATVSLVELLYVLGVNTRPAELVLQRLNVDPLDRDTGLRLVLETWQRHRPGLRELANPCLHGLCSLAADRLNCLRILAVMGGTWSSHIASYHLASVTAGVGRDLVALSLGLDESEYALAAWEATRSRALCDWMGRTHPITHLTVRRDFIGSIGEVLPASLDTMRAAVADTGVLLLAFFVSFGAVHVWLLQPDGTVLDGRADVPGDALLRLFEALPYGATSNELLRSGALADFFLDLEAPDALDPILDRITEQLLPPAIAEALLRSSATRLVIMPDAELDLLPFCCLRIGGAYMLERFELSYWPSVSAWLLCCNGMSERSDLPPLVIGDPAFGATGDASKIALPRLPASKDEAQMVAGHLGVEPKLGEGATVGALLDAFSARQRGRAGIPIVHLATHGVLNMSDPEHSFLALADGVLNVQFLHRYDPGLRAGLVVLSACQTALGRQHSDSVIGLTNALLIAGACAVVSTLWKVPDSSTRDLMEMFYDLLLSSRDATPGAALAKAQRAMLANPSTSHPFRWAAFSLFGADRHPCPAQCQRADP